MGGCCGAGSQMDDREMKKMTIKNRWKYLTRLGKGSFGVVYEVYDVNDSSKTTTYAMKIEFMKNETGRLPQEALILENMAQAGLTKHVPEIFDKGPLLDEPDKPKQFIVMTLLGPDLNELKKISPNSKFSPSTVALVAVQCINACRDLHKTGFVHRDIKPHNFMTGLKESKRNIYMIDFGMAKQIIDSKGRLMPPRDNAPFRGTLRYCAPDSHKGIEYGRHHDLWCLFNSLVELRKGELPWSAVGMNVRRMFDVKRKIVPSKWLADIELEYLTFYEYMTTLRYSMEPDYDLFRGIFIRILNGSNLRRESPMDWEEGGENYEKLDKTVLKKMFREADGAGSNATKSK